MMIWHWATGMRTTCKLCPAGLNPETSHCEATELITAPPCYSSSHHHHIINHCDTVQLIQSSNVHTRSLCSVCEHQSDICRPWSGPWPWSWSIHSSDQTQQLVNTKQTAVSKGRNWSEVKTSELQQTPVFTKPQTTDWEPPHQQISDQCAEVCFISSMWLLKRTVEVCNVQQVQVHLTFSHFITWFKHFTHDRKTRIQINRVNSINYSSQIQSVSDLEVSHTHTHFNSLIMKQQSNYFMSLSLGHNNKMWSPPQSQHTQQTWCVSCYTHTHTQKQSARQWVCMNQQQHGNFRTNSVYCQRVRTYSTEEDEWMHESDVFKNMSKISTIKPTISFQHDLKHFIQKPPLNDLIFVTKKVINGWSVKNLKD